MLFTDEDNKVTDDDHVTGKYKGSAHWNCNTNLRLTKNRSVIFYNLRGYACDLTMQEIHKFDVKINVIPNRLEKYMAFIINNNWIFINRMQFMNSSLGSLVKNLSDNGFKYLSQEFSGNLLKLVKQKGVCPYDYTDSFKKLFDKKLPDFSLFKNKCISEKDYLHENDIWNMLKMKNRRFIIS